jgi:pimeloyl-ACP methyl ester carboxylesterase
LTLPGTRAALSLWVQTWPGAWQWTTGLSQLLFAQPYLIAWSWYERMYRMALRRSYLEATLSALVAANTDSEIVLDQLHRLPQPVLVLWGDQDLIFPVWQGRAAVNRLHRGRLVVLPGCGHTAQVEHPYRVAAALGEFFRATGGMD